MDPRGEEQSRAVQMSRQAEAAPREALQGCLENISGSSDRLAQGRSSLKHRFTQDKLAKNQEGFLSWKISHTHLLSIEFRGISFHHSPV